MKLQLHIIQTTFTGGKKQVKHEGTTYKETLEQVQNLASALV